MNFQISKGEEKDQKLDWAEGNQIGQSRMSEALGDAAQIAQIIGEFYSTADEHRRAQLNAYLCQIRNGEHIITE